MMEAAFPPKQSYPPTILHGVTAQKITFWTLTAVRAQKTCTYIQIVRILHVPFLWEHANSINRMMSLVIPGHLNIKTMHTVLHRKDTTIVYCTETRKLPYIVHSSLDMSTTGNYLISWKNSNKHYPVFSNT
jgi:hypothetical protein